MEHKATHEGVDYCMLIDHVDDSMIMVWSIEKKDAFYSSVSFEISTQELTDFAMPGIVFGNSFSFSSDYEFVYMLSKSDNRLCLGMRKCRFSHIGPRSTSVITAPLCDKLSFEEHHVKPLVSFLQSVASSFPQKTQTTKKPKQPKNPNNPKL